MKIKKTVEKAFAITLVILSIIGTFSDAEHIGSIIYAVIVPSFILSVISFISEISDKCQENAEKIADAVERLSKTEEDLANEHLKLYNQGSHEQPYVEGVVPEKIYKLLTDSVEHRNETIINKDVQIFCLKFKKICNILIVFGYVLLFTSLCFSPYLRKWISNINLNCLTLWSLTLLYFTLEFKSECCARTYYCLYKFYKKLRKREECKRN